MSDQAIFGNHCVVVGIDDEHGRLEIEEALREAGAEVDPAGTGDTKIAVVGDKIGREFDWVYEYRLTTWSRVELAEKLFLWKQGCAAQDEWSDPFGASPELGAEDSAQTRLRTVG